MTEMALARCRWTRRRGRSCPCIPEQEPETAPSSPSYGSYLGPSPFHAGPILHLHTFRSLSILLALAPSQGPTCFNRPCPQGHPTPAHPITHPLHPLSCTCALINTCVDSTPSLSSGTITSVPSHPFHYHLGGEIQAITGPRASMPLSVFCSQPARPRRKYMHPSCCCF